MSAESRVLTKRVMSFCLSENDDLDSLFPPEYGHIIIWADSVRIEGRIRLPGRSLNIYARSIDPRPAGDRPASLDVSAPPAAPDFVPQAASPKLNGSPAAPDGRPGQAGGAGQNGGRVSIVVDRVEAAFEIAANGSKGGNSQRGGNGAQSARVDGVDGAFLKAKWPAKGKFGGGVLQKPGISQRYVSWAAGQKGGDARQGGAAGAAGQPGAGGHGGEIYIRLTGPDKSALTMNVAGGNAGLPGQPAKPGAASAPGAGGRNLMYAYDITKTRQGFARSRADSVLDSFARKYKIPARAANGKKGAGPGKVPLQPSAKAGKSGKSRMEQVTYRQVAGEFFPGFLQLVLTRADRDSAADNRERALQRYRWLVHLTVSRAKSDKVVAEIWRAAREGVSILEEDAAA